MPDQAGSQLHAVCFGAEDPAGLARFWAGALRWEVGDVADSRVELVPTDGTRLTLAFVSLGPDQTSRRRLHLDLTTSSPDDQQRTADDLVALGGRHVDIGQTPDEGHLVLADPEGNLLCLIEPDNNFLADCPRLGCINSDGRRETGVFWSEALGWPLIWDEGDETAIRGPDGSGPIMSWGGAPLNPKDGTNRLRLELAASGDPHVELAQLIALGATSVEGDAREGTTTLADPDGNEFAVRPEPQR